jgi:hypothetical protein
MAQTMKPYWPYTTPESKRELAASYRRQIAEYGNPFDMDPDFWEALATLQEQGRLDEWRAVRDAWKAAKPHPTDLLTD